MTFGRFGVILFGLDESSDFSIIGIRSAKNISILADSLDIKIGEKMLVLNKVTGDINNIQNEIDKTQIKFAGVIPYDKIEQFAEKLGLNSKKLLSEFEKEKSLQYTKINAFYNAVANNDYKNAIQLKDKLDQDLIISSEGKKS